MFDQEFFRAILLGVVQGITEFLPISSDGHLALMQFILDSCFGKLNGANVKGKELELTLILHVGTLLAIIVIYWNDLIRLFRQPRLCGLIVLATIPVGVVGLAFKKYFEEAFQSPLIAGVGLLVTAGVLLAGQRWERPRIHDVQDLTPLHAFWIGCCQALAPFPGVSRSGTTIAGGLICGLERVAAARFSFLMAVPAISAACLLEFKDIVQRGYMLNGMPAMVAGTITSAVVGYLALNWLLRIVTQRRLHWFAYYCIVVGTITVIVSIVPIHNAKPVAVEQSK
jgi:undecaprenyl-diphosphatase